MGMEKKKPGEDLGASGFDHHSKCAVAEINVFYKQTND